jgi:peptidoglycan/LPS O-acetylase OafA/YrhL
MRGLAALMVLLFHAREATWVPYATLPAGQQNLAVAVFFGATRFAIEAVLVFFVLSGALVGGQILSRIKAGRFSLSHYAIDRASRILLPLVPACLFTAAINLVAFQQATGLGQLLANMSGLNGVLAPSLSHNAPVWSLAYEIWFYILGGALGYIVTQNRNILAFPVLCVCAEVFNILGERFLLYWLLGAVTTLALQTPYKKMLFVLGAAVAAFGSLFNQLSYSGKPFAFDLAGQPFQIVRSFTASPWWPGETSNQPLALYSVSPGTAQLLVCVGVCLLLPLLYSAPVNNALERIAAPARFLSGMSYTLYLVHYPTIAALNRVLAPSARIDPNSVSHFLIRLGVSLAVAAGFYFLFERNTPWLRRRLRAMLA